MRSKILVVAIGFVALLVISGAAMALGGQQSPWFLLTPGAPPPPCNQMTPWQCDPSNGLCDDEIHGQCYQFCQTDPLGNMWVSCWSPNVNGW